jgi:hypothetical protein
VRLPNRQELRNALAVARTLRETVEGRYVSHGDYDGGDWERKIASELVHWVKGRLREARMRGVKLKEGPRPFENYWVHKWLGEALSHIKHKPGCPQIDYAGPCDRAICGISDVYRNITSIMTFGSEPVDWAKAIKGSFERMGARKAMEQQEEKKEPTWQDLVREEAKKIPAWATTEIDNGFADYIMFEHTGFPSFWNIPEDGKTPEECARTQVKKFFESCTPAPKGALP